MGKSNLFQGVKCCKSWRELKVPVATVACFFVFMFFVLVICSDLEGDNLVGRVEEIGVDQGESRGKKCFG